MSRQATQLAMGPWFVRDDDRPFMPGFNEAILRHQVAAGRIKADTIVRGPTTQQFWMPADQTPGLSRLLGKCHACGGQVSAETIKCGACHADLSLPKDVDRLGLSYTTPAERKHAQAEVEALRAGKPAPPPPGEPVSVPVESTRLDADELQPIEDEPEAVTPEDDFHHAQDPSGAHEDLWEAAASTPVRRVKRRRGQDPVVIGLVALLLCVVTIGLFVIMTGGLGDENESGSSASTEGSTAPPEMTERTAEQVAALADPIVSELDQLRDDGVPEALADALDEIERLISRADRSTQRAQHTEAYERYAEAQTMLASLADRIESEKLIEEQLQEIATLRQAVDTLREQAVANDAERWLPTAWASGETAMNALQALLDAEQHEPAINALKQAEQAYQQASESGAAANLAVASRDTLDAAMQAGYPEPTLRSVDAAQVDRLVAKRAEGNRHLTNRDYALAERAFNAASDALAQAVQAVELARYRKAYAFDTGYQAAGALIAIAAGDRLGQTERASLTEAFDRLALPSNPASDLELGEDNAYQAAAEQLVNSARQTISSAHGDEVQACYEAGFQARIIEQSLTTLALTADQQKRIHQSLAAMQDQAAAAGWNIPRIRPVFELVRRANRNAGLGEAPEQTREAWSVLIGPLLESDTAVRIMDPVIAPSSPDDPELFPGLGTIGS